MTATGCSCTATITTRFFIPRGNHFEHVYFFPRVTRVALCLGCPPFWGVFPGSPLGAVREEASLNHAGDQSIPELVPAPEPWQAGSGETPDWLQAWPGEEGLPQGTPSGRSCRLSRLRTHHLEKGSGSRAVADLCHQGPGQHPDPQMPSSWSAPIYLGTNTGMSFASKGHRSPLPGGGPAPACARATAIV